MSEQHRDSHTEPVVLYVINSFDGGGAETGLVAMVRGGVFAGCQLTLTALVQGSGGIEKQLMDLGHEPQILLNKSRMRPLDLPVLFVRLRKLIHRIKPSVVVASLPQANLLSRLNLMFRKETLFVSFEHNSHLAKRAYEIGYRLTSSRVDWVFADAESTLQTALQRLYIRPPPKRSIVPLVSFLPSDQRVVKASSSRTFHIVNAARFTPIKNQAALIEAVARLDRGVMLTLYGEGPTLDECKALASRLGISGRVNFPGFVPNWASSPADLFVLSSTHEGLCIVVLEAMHAGIPVAAPMIGGLCDYAASELIYELPTVDAGAIANAIAVAMDDRKGGAILAKKAQRMVELRFGADVVQITYREINLGLIAWVDGRCVTRTTPVRSASVT